MLTSWGRKRVSKTALTPAILPSAVKTSRRAAAERERIGHFDVGRELLARRHQRSRAFDQCLELGLAVARRDLVAKLCADAVQRLLDVGAARVQFGGDL